MERLLNLLFETKRTKFPREQHWAEIKIAGYIKYSLTKGKKRSLTQDREDADKLLMKVVLDTLLPVNCTRHDSMLLGNGHKITA